MTLPTRITTLIEQLCQNQTLGNAYIIHSHHYPSAEKVATALKETWCPAFKKEHPDTIDLIVEKTIKIDDIRHIQEQIKYGPSYEKSLIVTIHSADKLTVQAANAFLKTLESPPENVTFILVTENPHMLIDTIRSRCQSIYTPPFLNNDLSPQLTLQSLISQTKGQRHLQLHQTFQEKESLQNHVYFWLEESTAIHPLEKQQQIQTKLMARLDDMHYHCNLKSQLDALAIELGG